MLKFLVARAPFFLLNHLLKGKYLNSDVVNFFRVLRDPEKSKELIRLLELTPYSREEYEFCKHTLGSTQNDVEKAYKFFVVQNMCFKGLRDTWESSLSRNQLGIFYRSVNELALFSERLKSVYIEHSDFRKIFSMYDSENTFFFVDPPYLLENSDLNERMYSLSFSFADHLDLINILLNIKGKAMLTSYPNEVHRTLEEHGWHKIEIRKKLKISPGKEPVSECIWINYDFETSLWQTQTE
ncbi:MAG: DNA adenine methylase [Conexivisphaerales archaeon]